MKLVLEKADLIKILAKTFDINPERVQVKITPEPFEVELSDLPLVLGNTSSPENTRGSSVMSDPPAKVSPQADVVEDPTLLLSRADLNVQASPPPPGLDGSESTESVGSVHPKAMLEISDRLAEELESKHPFLKNRTVRTSKEPGDDFSNEV